MKIKNKGFQTNKIVRCIFAGMLSFCMMVNLCGPIHVYADEVDERLAESDGVIADAKEAADKAAEKLEKAKAKGNKEKIEQAEIDKKIADRLQNLIIHSPVYKSAGETTNILTSGLTIYALDTSLEELLQTLTDQMNKNIL